MLISTRLLLIRWSLVRAQHVLPKIQQKAHEFRLVDFLLSDRPLGCIRAPRHEREDTTHLAQYELGPCGIWC